MSGAAGSLRPFPPRGGRAGARAPASARGWSTNLARAGGAGRRGRGAEDSARTPSRRPHRGPGAGSPGLARAAAGPVWKGSAARQLGAAGKPGPGRGALPCGAPGPFHQLGVGCETLPATSPLEVLGSTGGAGGPRAGRWPRVALSPLLEDSGQGRRGGEVGEGAGTLGLGGLRNSVWTAWAAGGSAASGRGRGRVPASGPGPGTPPLTRRVGRHAGSLRSGHLRPRRGPSPPPPGPRGALGGARRRPAGALRAGTW